MQRYSVPPGDDWGLGPGPFVFSGQPPLLTGEVELANRSDHKVRVRAIPTTGGDREKLPGYGLDEVKLAAVLAPGGRARLRGHIVIPLETPPGTYTTALDCGGQRETVVAHVFEQIAVELSPDEIQTRGAGGDVLSFRVIATNRGNVTHTLPDHGLLFLEERAWVNRSLVFALRETEEKEGHEAYLDRVVRELRATLVRPAQVTFTARIAALPPGATEEIEIELPLPQELIKGRAYVGTLALLDAELTFEVLCNGATNSRRRRPR